LISFQVEPYEDICVEIQTLNRIHWEELALFKDRMPLSPQYDVYIERDRRGELFFVTGRWNSRIVAYYCAQVNPGFHYKTTIIGIMDIIYIDPEFRQRGLIFPLMRGVQRELKRRGVQLWISGYKTHNPLGMPKVLDLLGFQSGDTYCSKWIGDEVS